MPRITAIWKQVLDSLWFVPGLLTLAGGGAAVLLVGLERGGAVDLRGEELWWLFGGGAEGARGVLGAIAGGIITVTGVVFSVTIVALQLASTQFTPRVLRHFMADRIDQVVLGVFIATFTYTILVQRSVRSGAEGGDEFVPAVAITGAVVLVLVSIGFLIVFIDHLARSIQAESIISRIAHDTLAVIDRFGEGEEARAWPPLPSEEAAVVLAAHRAGYIQALDEDRLLEVADRQDLVMRVDAAVGAFVLPGQPLLMVWNGAVDKDAEKEIRSAFVLGPNRTTHQDVAFGIIELVDIAVKALSPGINDPTTAMTAIDRLGQLVLEVGRRMPGDSHVAETGGTPRVLVSRLGLERAVELAFDEIRHFGASNPAVAIRLAHTLGTVASLLPDDRRGPTERQLRLLRADSERAIAAPSDRERVLSALDDALSGSTATRH